MFYIGPVILSRFKCIYSSNVNRLQPHRCVLSALQHRAWAKMLMHFQPHRLGLTDVIGLTG